MSFIKNIFGKVSSLLSSDEEENLSEASTPPNTINTEQATREAEEIDEEFLENLEEELIRSDLGVSLAMNFAESLRKKSKKHKILKSDAPHFLKEFLVKAFESDRDPPGTLTEEKFQIQTKDGLGIYLFVGVNGVGKTTSIGKLAKRFKDQGKKVLIAAGDTFRAAAEDQLKAWAIKSGADFIEEAHGTKPSALVYKAIEKAQAESHDILLIDTAGRLQNKKNLMQELSKIKEVIDKNSPDSLCETFLVLDSSTGQNALSQARNFMEICNISGIFLSKFDGTAKAGIVFAIAHELGLPVKLLGTGEGIEDIEDFSPDIFVQKYL